MIKREWPAKGIIQHLKHLVQNFQNHKSIAGISVAKFEARQTVYASGKSMSTFGQKKSLFMLRLLR